MKKIDICNPCVRVYGLPLFYKNGLFERVPKNVREAVPSLEMLGRRCTGTRVCMRTNSKTVKVVMDFETYSPDIGMSIFACQSANVYIGSHADSKFMGLVNPGSYSAKHSEGTFTKSGSFEDVMVLIPRNEVIAYIGFEVDDDAQLELPQQYTYETPVLFYGSSITEGGCCSRLASAYPNIISRHLDTDYINFGFSGSAKGEAAMADYIGSLDISMLVMDYDYNSPSPEHLAATHEAFFKQIRRHKPELPVLILSCPNPEYMPEAEKRLEIIRQTYENALAAGDKNVYFINGREFYGETDRDYCTVDTTHPTDLGFYRMANVIEPVIKKVLELQHKR